MGIANYIYFFSFFSFFSFIDEGLEKKSKCKNCLIGRSSDMVGETMCNLCSAGTYQTETGQVNCVSCPAGQASSEIGRIIPCDDCTVGYYSATSKAQACTSCPKGREGGKIGGTTIVSACASCPTGWSGTISSRQAEVASSSTTSSTTSSCSLCDYGTFASKPSQSKCDVVTSPCVAGFYSDSIGNKVNDASCKPCPTAKYSNLVGSSSCKSCPSCGVGTFGGTPPGSSSCIDCIACPAGKIADKISQTSCTECPSGQVSNKEGTACVEWDSVCDPIGSGCIEIHTTETCVRKLCPDPNAVMPDPMVWSRYMQNLSAASCSTDVVSFMAEKDFPCQKCSIDGKCNFGWCETINHDTMNRCAVCNKGYYTADCVECPSPAVALASDITIVGGGAYLLLCFLYMMLLNVDQGAKSAREGAKTAGLGGVLVNQIQVAATIMAGMRWSPNIPQWIVIVLNALCFLTSFNVSFLLATPECSSNLNPRGRWLSSMAIPLAVVFLCFFWALTTQLWLRCRGKVEAAVKTNRIILQASVYICLIGLYQVWVFSAWSLTVSLSL